MQSDARVRKHAKVVSRHLGEGEGGVLLHLESGQYHGLNSIGWAIWTSLDGARTVREVVDALRQSVEDPSAHLEDDVVQFLQGLLERGLITVSLD